MELTVTITNTLGEILTMRQLKCFKRNGLGVAAAVAVAIGFGSTAANALNMPAYGTSAPQQGVGLVLGIWNQSTGAGEQVNLGYLYDDVALATGALTPDSGGTPFSAPVANPTGAAGNVYQLNFGTIPDFSTLFGSGSGADYMVVSENGTPDTATSVEYTYVNDTQPSTFVQADLNVMINSIGGQAWTGTAGYTTDTTGTAPQNPLAGTFAGGTLGLNANFSGAVGSSLEFFNTVAGSGRGSQPTNTAYANAQGDGFWFLSSGGDLTWNVLAAQTAPVPLPAAVWLFASGLAGLGAIGRRRRAA